MIFVVSGQDAIRHSALMEQVYRLQREAFADGPGRDDLVHAASFELACFNPDVIHQICVRDGKVAGYQRMMWLDAPFDLGQFRVWEPNAYWLTRQCVAPAFCGSHGGPASVEGELVAGLVEWALACRLKRAVVEWEPAWILRASQLRFLVNVVGFRSRGNRQTVVAVLEFNRSTLQAIREYRNHRLPVISLLGENDGDRTARHGPAAKGGWQITCPAWTS